MAETAAPPLSPLADAPAELEIRKESWKRSTLDLVAGDRSFARIDYSMWSGKAKAETAEGTFAFSGQKGVFSGRIEVRTGADGPVVAELDLSTWSRGGTVEVDGTSYEIAAKGILKERWRCERDGTELFGLQETGSFGKGKAHLELAEAGREDPHLALLLLLTVHANAVHDSQAAVTGSLAASSGAVAASS